MPSLRNDLICVLGGTGFLGRRIVRRLRDHGHTVRVGSRHPERARSPIADERLQPVRTDILDEGSLAAALAGARGAVNAVSLYVERANATFRSVHVEGAARVAREAHRAGVERLIHVSGIGADPGSRSPYIRSRGEGELAVNDGRTKLQPADVEDVAEAIALAFVHDQSLYELGGPRIYTYEGLLRTITQKAGLKPVLVPVPFSLWQALAWTAELLPHPPVTRNQVELMRIDTIAGSEPGFEALGISPRPLEDVLDLILSGGPAEANAKR